MKKVVSDIIRRCIEPEWKCTVENDILADIYPHLKCHGILAIGYDGLVRCGVDKSHPVMQQLFRDYISNMMRSERQMAEKDRLLAIFRQHGIDYLPLKGCNMKALYPRPELRVMGDADILIRAEDYPRAEEILIRENYRFDQRASHTKNWRSRDLYLEIHTRVIPDSDEDYFDYYKDGWARARQKQAHWYEYSPEDEFIYIFTHFARHFRTGGIGYRQLIDLWVFSSHYRDMDYEYIAGEMEKLQCRQFYENVMKTVSACFEGGPADEKTEFISDFIFDSGNWGTKASHTISMGLKGNTKGVKGRLGTKLYMLKTARFPELKLIRIRYPVLHRCPWLLPVFWVVRWVDAVVNRRHNVRNKMQEVQDVNEAEVLRRRKRFEAIGLQYNFEKKEN